jgi:hypothetical protein
MEIEQFVTYLKRSWKPKEFFDRFDGTPMKQFENGAAVVFDQSYGLVTINPLKEGSRTAKDENVITYANFVFEIDDEDLIAQNKRAHKLVRTGIVNRVVYSGKKSLHCRITLKRPPNNKEDYHKIWTELNEKYFEGKADKHCKNPARLTRAVNFVHDEKRKFQTVCFVGDSTI